MTFGIVVVASPLALNTIFAAPDTVPSLRTNCMRPLVLELRKRYPVGSPVQVPVPPLIAEGTRALRTRPVAAYTRMASFVRPRGAPNAALGVVASRRRLPGIGVAA